MAFLNLIIRLALSLVLFYFLIWQWTLVPFVDKEVSLNLVVASTFFGNNQPTGWVRECLLLSRAGVGFAAIAFVLVPAATFFGEFEMRPIRNTITILGVAVAVIGFLAALVFHFQFSI